MTEKDFQTKFSTWAKYNIKQTTAFELKLTKTPSLSFSVLALHQEQSLLLAKHKCLTHKIADEGYAPKPFDGFTLCNSPAFVVIMFYQRGQKQFYMIDIDDWVSEKANSKRQSITEDRARAIGVHCLLA